MNHNLIDILPIWLIKVFIDMCILYVFIRVSKHETKPNNFYHKDTYIDNNFLP
jgi:phage terminase large subunit